MCVLCDQVPETADHLCLHCPFARKVWNLMESVLETKYIRAIPDANKGVEDWWNSELMGMPDKARRVKAALMMCTRHDGKNAASTWEA